MARAFDKKALIKFKGRTIASKIPQGRYCYAMFATVDSKRDRHSHFLTKPRAEEMVKTFKTPSAREFGFKNVKVINVCKRRR